MSDAKPNARGTLILASNCLGLPDDIPQRSLTALRESDLLVFEEDRPARQALKAAGIHRDYLKFTEHNEASTREDVKQALKSGQTVCYMSDQGVPTLADPGSELLKIAYSLDAPVRVIPGPSSVTAALAACPFLESRFLYYGFLPREPDKRSIAIAELAQNPHPIVFLDTPYRRKALLEALSQGFGGDRKALLAVDISGDQEGFYHRSLDALADLTLDKLNFVIVVQGAATKSRPKKKRRPH
ncbi:SAM-dependent methyltransferase [Pseudobacteriovorax antillogorgiicola]|uniref:16S rRNA (Cytidine1402-2'-O)-methyltransferase n=1 Tax=Pseudobacteriovorax antillogorgiicola TaxID=1513793 RepID=A0A1Y6B4P7_9BACT|nr:SAM-dependent methyltransferase [Pseudobacteriovorax antillogorgiicola]TCS59544.1 16S rRNA (cytidine1402-2'-O)-methyltransferase [Pseudobacteriovorax antillogorgiicola]SME87769.1 16S rRNA (cytidine1402-2'-O)-methyltransferase [Pseudobacteriovorax antillogorgiicola]